MKKFLSIFLIVAIAFGSLSITVFAQETKTIYSFEACEGQKFYYYKDKQGNPYIVDNGNMYYIEVPEFVEKITDESQLEQLRREFNNNSISKLETSAKSDVLFSETVIFNPLARTGVLNVSDNYLYLKCSKLNPSDAKRGFSYWIFYSFDNREWTRAFYVNKSLSVYTRHPWTTFGKAPYIKIEIFSYYGTVSSCLFSVKQGGILG